jgi:hypothetical protein
LHIKQLNTIGLKSKLVYYTAEIYILQPAVLDSDTTALVLSFSDATIMEFHLYLLLPLTAVLYHRLLLLAVDFDQLLMYDYLYYSS